LVARLREPDELGVDGLLRGVDDEVVVVGPVGVVLEEAM
jgi:hypothetical protein